MQNISNTKTSKYESLKQRLLSRITLIARQNGEAKLPVNIDHYKVLCIEPIKNEIQGAMNQNQQEFAPIAGMVIASELEKKFEVKKKEQVSKKNNAEQDLIPVNEKIKLLPLVEKESVLQSWGGLILTILLAIAESFLGYHNIRLNNFDTISATVFATFLGILILFGTHFFGKHYTKTTDAYKKKKLLVVVNVIGILIFIMLGNFRVNGLAIANKYANNDTTQGISNPNVSNGVYLAFISYLVFLLGLYLSVRYSKNDSQTRTLKESETLAKEERKLQEIIEQSKQEIKESEEKMQEQKNSALKNWEIAVANENELVSIAEIVRSAYNQANVSTRQDSILPTFFSNPFDFQFQKFFDNHKTN